MISDSDMAEIGAFVEEADGTTRPVRTAAEWKAASQSDRNVARTHLTPDVYVSTVFLVIEHGFERGGDPLLYESMVFVVEHGQSWCERYTSRADARLGHLKMVEALRKEMGLADALRKAVGS